MKIKVTLFTCKTCNRGYNNPLDHTCKISFSKAGQKKVGGVKRTPKKK
ncbi:hypothetical protein [Streptosporangium roseum]